VYKIGDKVKIKDNIFFNDKERYWWAGKTGTIIRKERFYYVTLDGSDNNLYDIRVSSDEIEKVKEKKMYQVGDKIKIKDNLSFSGDEKYWWAGRIATIRKILLEGSYDYLVSVKTDTDEVLSLRIKDSEIEDIVLDSSPSVSNNYPLALLYLDTFGSWNVIAEGDIIATTKDNFKFKNSSGEKKWFNTKHHKVTPIKYIKSGV
jgi:hypothetical protein